MGRRTLLCALLVSCGFDYEPFPLSTQVCVQLDAAATGKVTELEVSVEPEGSDDTLDVTDRLSTTDEVGFTLAWEKDKQGPVTLTLVARGDDVVAEGCAQWDIESPPVQQDADYIGMCLREPPAIVSPCPTPAFCNSSFSCPFNNNSN
jgi:hypothetical protein